MQLYDVPASPNCRKVRVLARELGLNLVLVPVPLQTKPEDYRSKNPTGKVPTLVVDDDGLVVWESGANPRASR